MIRLLLQGIAGSISVVYVLKQRHKKRRICRPVRVLVFRVLHDPNNFVISATLGPAKSQMLAQRFLAANIVSREGFIDHGDRLGIWVVLLPDTASTQHLRPSRFEIMCAHTIPRWRTP